MDHPLPSKIFLKADAQVGTLVVPKSGTGRAVSPCEGSAHQPAPSLTAHRSGGSRLGLASCHPAPKAKDTRPTPMSVRATAVQRDAVKARARAVGLSVSQYFLIQALGADLVPVRLTPADRAERAKVLQSYRGTGNLLNQIAKHLNSGRIVGGVDIQSAIRKHEANAALMLNAFLRGLPQ